MLELIFLAFFVLAAFGTGSLLLSIFRFRFHSFSEEFFFSIAIGYGVVALLTYLLGFYGLLYRQVFTLLFLALLAVSFGRVKHAVTQLLASQKVIPKLNTFSVLVAVIIFFSVFNLVASLAPPWSYDTTTYHLAVPKIYAMEHGFVALPSLFHSNFVMIPGMAFLAAFVVKNGVLANLVNFTFSVLLALGIYSFCSRFLNKKAGVIASAIFLTLPIIAVYSASAHADIPQAFFAFSAFYAFIVWAERSSNSSPVLGWFIVSAFMTGLVAASKFTGLAFVAIMASLMFFYGIFAGKHGPLPRLLKTTVLSTAAFILLALVVAFPAYLKNWVYSGNPFFPLYYNIFGGKFLNANVSEFFSTTLQHGTGISLGSFLITPWNITMHPLMFIELIGIGPLFLAFIPLLLFVKRNRIIVLTLATGLLPLIPWFLTSQNLRYLTYTFPFLSIVTAFVIYSLANSAASKALRSFIAVVVAVVLVSNTVLLFGANAKQLPVALGLESEADFFAKLKDGQIYGMCQFTNSNLPASARILLLYEDRGYHCDTPYIIGDPRQQAFIDYSKISNAEDYAKRLWEIGVTHIIVNKANTIHKPGDMFYSNETAAIIESLIKNYGTLAHSEGGAELYSFAYGPGAS
ncbi:glycosyltransferase family 39 protein [Candidatus Woesearchaeota archaeon]|nr:glycosyltransferase family 39 protein [Candidatus Woesearchaeota archaeon]